MTKQSKCSSTYQTNRKPHNRTVTNHTPPLIKETKCTKPLTNFFVRFEDNIKVSTNLQPNQSKRLSSSISEKFSQLCKNSFSNKHPLKNLLNFNLEDNSIKPLGKNKQLVKDFYNLPIDETLEENNAYYANNCDPKLASVSPGVNYLIDQISKLNEHHVNTSRFTFYENKLKMIGMIYSKLRTNASISDSLALCPSQSSFSILKQAEILDKIEQKKVSSSNPMPCTTLTEAIQFTDAPNVQGTLHPATSDVSISTLNLFGDNFGDSDPCFQIDKELISSIMNDKNNDFLFENSPIANNIAPPIIIPQNFVTGHEALNDQIAKDQSLKDYRLEFVCLLINVLLKICYCSINQLDVFIAFHEDTSVDFKISKFDRDIYVTNAKSRRTNLMKEIKNMTPANMSTDKFTEFTLDDLIKIPLFTEIYNFLVEKIDFNKNMDAYHNIIETYYQRFCEQNVKNGFRTYDTMEFKLVMYDLICNVILKKGISRGELSKGQFKNIDFIMRTFHTHIADTVEAKYCVKDPRKRNEMLTKLMVEFDYKSIILDCLPKLDAPSNPAFVESSYVRCKYLSRITDESLMATTRIVNISELSPTLQNSTEDQHQSIEDGSKTHLKLQAVQNIPISPLINSASKSQITSLMDLHILPPPTPQLRAPTKHFTPNASYFSSPLFNTFPQQNNSILTSDVPLTPVLNMTQAEQNLSWISQKSSSQNLSFNSSEDIEILLDKYLEKAEKQKQTPAGLSTNKRSIFERLSSSRSDNSLVNAPMLNARSHSRSIDDILNENPSDRTHEKERKSVFNRLGSSSIRVSPGSQENDLSFRKRALSYYRFDSDREDNTTITLNNQLIGGQESASKKYRELENIYNVQQENCETEENYFHAMKLNTSNGNNYHQNVDRMLNEEFNKSNSDNQTHMDIHNFQGSSNEFLRSIQENNRYMQSPDMNQKYPMIDDNNNILTESNLDQLASQSMHIEHDYSKDLFQSCDRVNQPFFDELS